MYRYIYIVYNTAYNTIYYTEKLYMYNTDKYS